MIENNWKKEKIYNLFQCNDCNNNNTVTQSNHRELKGCKTVQCKQCANTWYICEIHKLRFSRLQFAKCKDHFNTCHKIVTYDKTLFSDDNGNNIYMHQMMMTAISQLI